MPIDFDALAFAALIAAQFFGVIAVCHSHSVPTLGGREGRCGSGRPMKKQTSSCGVL